MSDELKPCPFCGADAEHIHVYDGEEIVRCAAQCGAGFCGDTRESVIASWNRRPTPEQSREDEARCDVGHAHFTPFYLLANARGIVSREYSRKPNWVLAMRLFAVGSTTANRICREAGIDPDGTTITRAAIDAAMDRSALGREG